MSSHGTVDFGKREYKPLDEEQRALFDVIMYFKDEDTSPLAAALNVIMNHAITIRQQHDALKEIRDRMESWQDDLLELTKPVLIK